MLLPFAQAFPCRLPNVYIATLMCSLGNNREICPNIILIIHFEYVVLPLKRILILFIKEYMREKGKKCGYVQMNSIPLSDCFDFIDHAINQSCDLGDRNTYTSFRGTLIKLQCSTTYMNMLQEAVFSSVIFV